MDSTDGSVLTSRALQAFMVVAEELHFGRAAQRLHISQPPLSQQIRQFEQQVGTPLFVRTTRSVQLTAAGQMLRDRARALWQDADAALAAVRRAAQGDVGTLAIGFTSSAAYKLMPAALAAYRQRYPQVEIRLTEAISSRLIDMLLTDRIDIALLRHDASYANPGIQFAPAYRENLCVALYPTHTLARQRTPIRPQQLDGVDLVGFSAAEAPYFRSRLLGYCARFGIQPRITHESMMPTLLSLVEAGVGIALVPESAARLYPEGVVYRTLADADEALAIDLYTARRPDQRSPLVQAFDQAVLGVSTPAYCRARPQG